MIPFVKIQLFIVFLIIITIKHLFNLFIIYYYFFFLQIFLFVKIGPQGTSFKTP